jgi:glycosyltransferase involved in cell wall biosynthesis
MNDPKISVIIPNYNNAKFLEQCLISVLDQTYDNLEIIISDDASTDHSTTIADKYRKLYPEKVIVHVNDQNVGISRNRHIAIKISNGFYVTTLDSDDYYASPKKIEKEYALIKYYIDNYDQEIIAFSNIIVEDQQGKFHDQSKLIEIRQGNIFNDIIARKCMIPRDFVFSKKLYYEVGGYDEQIEIYEDWDLKIRLAKNYNFYYTGINGVVYRRHGLGLSFANKAKHIYWLKKIFLKNEKLISQTDKIEIHEKFSKFLTNLQTTAKNDQISQIKKYMNKGLLFSFLKAFLRHIKYKIQGIY